MSKPRLVTLIAHEIHTHKHNILCVIFPKFWKEFQKFKMVFKIVFEIHLLFKKKFQFYKILVLHWVFVMIYDYTHLKFIFFPRTMFCVQIFINIDEKSKSISKISFHLVLTWIDRPSSRPSIRSTWISVHVRTLVDPSMCRL